ncbi:MAG: methionyl-tRNA formyltransferase [Symbiobacteriia bacterium]
MKVVFMGTPDFAVPSLNALVEAGHEVQGVVTQPDRPKGRSGEPVPPPVKVAAQRLGLPVLQPERLRLPEAQTELFRWQPDLAVVVAFGQILRPAVLAWPRLGCINVHASLLPRYRGAAPIHWAIIRGEAETGVTTMWMDAGMDTGDMILTSATPIGPTETTGHLHDRLAGLGADLLRTTLAQVAAGTAPRQAQPHELATMAPLLKPEHEVIDWSRPAADVANLVRGLSPWPVAHTTLDGQRVKVWRAGAWTGPAPAAAAAPAPVAGAAAEPAAAGLQPGEFAGAARGEGLLVAAGQGLVLVQELQPAGSRRMTADQFLAGHDLTGKRFGV